jgi:hypothetical protein
MTTPNSPANERSSRLDRTLLLFAAVRKGVVALLKFMATAFLAIALPNRAFRTRGRHMLLLVAALLVRPVLASADEPTAADVAGAPASGEESGLVAPVDPGDSIARRTTRAVLLGPRLAVDIVFFPVRQGAGALERYQIVERTKRLLFNDAMTIGLVPTVQRESGFGVTAGAKFLHRDLFGDGEKLTIAAAAGGRFQQRHRVALESGDRFSDQFAIELDGEYERRPGEPYYAIGNGDDATREQYRHRVARTTAVVDVRPASAFHARASVALSDHETEGTMDSSMLVGSSRNVYRELELRWDSRRQGSTWEPPALPGAGTLAAVFAGRSSALDDGASFWRYGLDVQHYLRLATGPKLLILRAHAEGVSQSEDVPFYELPRLGGSTYLRGYSSQRFRDRFAAVASADYQWELSRNVAARLFVDAGRVFAKPGDFGFTDLRVGYGVGFDIHTEHSYLARTSLSSSRDGGVFLDFALDPAFELDRRIER